MGIDLKNKTENNPKQNMFFMSVNMDMKEERSWCVWTDEEMQFFLNLIDESKYKHDLDRVLCLGFG